MVSWNSADHLQPQKCVDAMICRVWMDQPFRVIPYDSVQRAMWRPIGDITGPWSSFSERFGITFTENDGRWEAPGPVAYAAVELPTGEQFRVEHWSQLLTSEDYRGLTPLTWAHVAMHGEFKLNMNSRLDLGHTSP